MENEELKKSEVTKIEGLEVFIDAEWTQENIPVSVQVNIIHPNGFDGKYVVINRIYKESLDEILLQQWEKENKAEIVFYDLGDDTNIVHTLLVDFYLKEYPLPEDSSYYFSGEVYMFYSFQDLGFAFGWNNVERQLIKEVSSKSKYKIEQRRSITGSLKIEDSSTSRLNKWKIRDLSGWTNTSLKDFASSLGIPMENKNLLDDLKANMDIALVQRTKTFLDYGLDNFHCFGF